MGTANTQIAKYSDVANKRIHNGFSASYATTATKCVNKGILQHVEFLEAKDRTVTTNPYYATPSNFANFGSGNMAAMKLVNNGYTTNQPISALNVYNTTTTYEQSSYASCAVRATTSIAAYTSVTVTLAAGWPDHAEDPGRYSMFYKQLTGISTGLVKLEYTISMEGICGDSPTTQSSPGTPGTYGVSNASITAGVIVTDNYGQIIGQRTPSAYSGNLITNSITFSASTSTINVYIIIAAASFTFTAGQSATCAGVKFKAKSNVISYASRYDLDTKCVQYQDINHPSGKKFTIYYGVWNNKSSNAKLNNLYVQIKKRTETSSWTTIGTAALPSSLNKSTTGSVTCTLPASYDPTVQYDFRVTAGDTNSNQKWYYRWGSQSSLTASGYQWTYYGKVQKGVCTNADGLNTHSPYSTLRNYIYSSSDLPRGRSASMAALFCIE